MSFIDDDLDDYIVDELIRRDKVREILSQKTDEELIDDLSKLLTSRYYNKNSYTDMMKNIVTYFNKNGTISKKQRDVVEWHIIIEDAEYDY